MLELIASIILLVSLVGIFFIISRKVSVLSAMPQNGDHGFKKPELLARVQNTIKAHHFHFFEKQMLLHRILSFVKIWTLRIETKIDTLLHGIRKKAQELDNKNK